MNTKKAPDKITTIKCPLKLILKDEKYKSIIFDACYRTNQIVIHTYQFLRLWILNKYNNNEQIPIIDENLIKMCFKSLIKESRGPKPKGNNSKLLEEFKNFYTHNYKILGLENLIDGSYLSQVLNNMAVDMKTNIENNIKLHFFKYVNRFVNSSFRKINNNLIDKADKGKKIELRKILNKDIYEIKQDLLNNTLKSNNKYHEWINKHRNNIFPKDYKKSYEFDVQNEPQKYIKSMIYMCMEIERENTKLFQFFPLRTDIVIKNIQIDTKSLIELFIKEDKGKLLKDIEKYKNEIWSMFFKLNSKIFKQNNYIFDYVISTDCHTVSIKFLNKKNMEEETKKKENKKNKKKENKEKTKDMTNEQKEEYKKLEKENKKNKETEYKLKLKDKKDKAKAEFKKLTKNEQQKKKDEIKKQQIDNNKELKYIDDLNDNELKQLDNNEWVVVDTGMRVPLYMKNKKGIRFRYSNKKHANRLCRFKYQKIIKKHKDKNNISKIENELSLYNSKSCNIEKFKDFIKNKNRVNKLLFEKYNDEIFRKYKWYGFLNKKHTDAKLVREIKQIFGKDTTIIYGDGSFNDTCKKGNISVPNKRIRNLLKENFKMYNIDEFRTSKIHYKSEVECENLYITDKKGKIRKIHSVLTYKMENKESGCINRDENAVNNMIKIVENQIKNKERPLKYRREKIKGNNHTKDKEK
jgi:hypothetical protein